LSIFVSQVGSLIPILKVKFNNGFKQTKRPAAALKELANTLSTRSIKANKIKQANKAKRSKALPLPAKSTQ
jgi:hypothetical protein